MSEKPWKNVCILTLKQPETFVVAVAVNLKNLQSSGPPESQYPASATYKTPNLGGPTDG